MLQRSYTEVASELKLHPKGKLPPIGWEFAPGIPGYIRPKQPPKPKDGVDGKDGKDGIDGRDGKDGSDGKDGLAGERGAEGPKGETGPKGEAGQSGKDGAQGRDGRDGLDGKDGVGIADIKTHGNDMLIKLSNGNEFKHRLAGGGGGTPFGGGSSYDGPRITVSTTEPINPAVNDIWFNPAG
jgi:hypothetical protein